MKNLQYYLELPYTVIMRRDEDGDYVARIDELPGCAAHGETPEQAFEALEEAKQLWITDCLESGDPVPEPSPEEVLPSGKWVQRVPRTLHKKLIALAKRENMSLNQLVTSILAEAVGVQRADHADHDFRMGERLVACRFVLVSGAQNLASLFGYVNLNSAIAGLAGQWSDRLRSVVVESLSPGTTAGTISNRRPMIIQPQREEEVATHG